MLFSLAIKQLIVKQLTKNKWSSEFIIAKGNQIGKCLLSHEWIYQRIWACKHGCKKEDADYKQLCQHLKHGKQRYKRGNKKVIGVLFSITNPLITVKEFFKKDSNYII